MMKLSTVAFAAAALLGFGPSAFAEEPLISPVSTLDYADGDFALRGYVRPPANKEGPLPAVVIIVSKIVYHVVCLLFILECRSQICFSNNAARLDKCR